VHCLRAPQGWNALSSTRWFPAKVERSPRRLLNALVPQLRETTLPRDLFAAPTVTVVAGVSPAARTTSQATRLPPQMAGSATLATAIHFSLLPNHPPSTRYGAAGIARRLQHSKLAPNPTTESAEDAESAEALVLPWASVWSLASE